MKKVFTFAVILFTSLFNSLAYAGQRDTIQVNQPVDIYAGVPHFFLTPMFNNGSYMQGEGIVTECPIKRLKNKKDTYAWNVRGFDVRVIVDNVAHLGYPGFDNNQIEYIAFNLKGKMDPGVGAGYFIEGVAGEWKQDPYHADMEIYVYSSYAHVTISMMSIQQGDHLEVGWEFDNKEEYKVFHNVTFRPKP